MELNDHDEVPLEMRSNRSREPTLEAEVLEGDTLASIALRFNCTVADLKRLNKIDKDFEIHARKTLKIPITAHNVLLDTLPAVHKSGNNSPKVVNGESTQKLEDLDERLIVASIANSEYVSSEYRDFPRGEGDPSITDPLDGVDAPIPTVVLAKPRMDFSINGSDCDLNWIFLFVCILALCFAIPLVYIFYIAEEKIHHDALIHEATVAHHDATHSL